jgi:uncharacterized membrane protein YhhN
MTHLLVLIPLNLIAIGLYMHARMRDDLKRVIVFQPGAVIISWLIAAAALLQPDTNTAFTLVVLAGMGIAIIGDFVNLDMENPDVVLRGLVIAVASYLTYAIGAAAIDGFHTWDLAVGAILLVFYVAFMRYLWPDLGEMRIPGLIYGLVLPFTFSRAVSTFFGTEFSTAQSVLFSLGTLGLYAADVEFAIHTYKRRLPRMFGPILYSGGQMLIALSTLSWRGAG